MPHAPLQFNTIACKHCGAIVALVPPGAYIHTTHMRCMQCSAVTTIKVIDNQRPKAYTDAVPA